MSRTGVMRLLLVCSSLLACASVDRLLDREPKPSPDEGAWSAQRERWTRKATLYDGLTMRALATATYQAPELRRARATIVAQWKALPDADREALIAKEDAEGTQYEDFVVSMTTGDTADNDLASKKTDWGIALLAPGAPDITGAEVVPLRSDALLTTLYPAISDFDSVYRIRFKRPAGVQAHPPNYTLRLAGPRGRIDFDFAPLPTGQPPSDAANGTAIPPPL